MRADTPRKTALHPDSAAQTDREWIAHLIAIDVPHDTVERLLAVRGVEGTRAARAIRRAHDDVRRARRILGAERRKVGWLFRIDAELATMTRPRGAVPRVPYTSVADVRRFYAANAPAVFSGMCKRWNALSWTPRSFAERYGDEPIEVETRRGHLPDLFEGGGTESSPVQLRTFMEALESTQRAGGYLVSRNGFMQDGRFAALYDDLVPLPKILNPEPELLRASTHLWFGGRGTETELHHDGNNILFVQLHGRKRFRLVPPYALFDVYPSAGVWSANRHCAADDPRFPASQTMEVCEVEVGPGDALLIPVGWWHHVTALDVSISLSFTNFYWPNYFGSPQERKSWAEAAEPAGLADSTDSASLADSTAGARS
jgi:hypothetical protein